MTSSEKTLRRLTASEIIDRLEEDPSKIDLSFSIVEAFDYAEIKRHWTARHPGEAFLPDVVAEHTTFQGAFLAENEVLGSLNASYATFCACAHLEKSAFMGRVICRHCVFLEDAVFDEATFTEQANFNSSTFDGAVTFQKSAFHSVASFMNTIFTKEAPNFSRAQFSGLAFFKRLTVLEKTSIANFDDVKFESTVRFFGIDCCGLSLTRCINHAMMDFEPMDDKDVRCLHYLSIREMINVGQINLAWDSKAINKLISSYPGNSSAAISDEFSLLKENYHSIGKYDWEDQAFLAHMRYKQKAARDKWRLLPAFGYKLIDLIGQYGINPSRVAGTMLTVWALFIPIYLLLFCRSPNFVLLPALFDSVLTSTFSLFGLGFSPLSSASGGYLFPTLIAVESAIGYFLLSYFLVALVRRTLR